MKRLRVDLIIVFTLFILLIISFSIVKGDSPIIVRNTTTMDAPYETGFADYGESDGKKDAQSDSQYDAQQGLVYASAFASKTSTAWAYSYLQDAFEIIHSSNYRITFSFDYKGLIEITGVDFILPSTANARVDLTAYLIRRNGEEIIGQKTETIADVTENSAQIITDQTSITLTIALEKNNIYDWRAELRTEASAGGYGETAIATVDFYDINQGYRAEIMQVSVEDLNPDDIPPTTTYSLSGTQGENGWFTSSVTTSLSATDNLYGVDYTNQRVNGGSWTHYASPFTISSEGTNTVEFYSVDKAGNEETTQSVNIKIDLNPPTGQLRINNNAQYTSSRDVSLTTLTQDGQGSGVTQMRFRNEGESYGGTWIPYTTSPTPWTLREGDGNKRVYAQFKDEAGYISPETYDEIILDTETPTTSASFSGTSGENDWFTSSVTTSLNSIDNYGVDYTNWRINDGTWNPYASPFSISSEGTNTFEFYSVDKAGNEETTQSVSIKIDKTEPTASVLINNGDTYSSTTMVTLSLTYSDAASGVSEVRYSNDGFWDTEAWEDPATTKNWNLISGDGEKTVYYQTKDYAGKLSPITYDEIILDTEPPLASILINKGDEYTNSTFVTLYLQYSDNLGIDLVRYSNDGVSYTKWERPSETREWTLLSGDGIKTVYAQFRDWAGLNSNFVSDTIILDTIPPTGSIEINDGASSTTSTSVTITPNATDANGVAQMRLRNDGGNWSDWEEVTTKIWNLTSELGAKTVFAQFKDNAGLISPTYNATINLVEPEPTPSPAPSPTPQPSPAPSGKGNIIVFVKDENNNPISGATVTSTVQPSGQSPLSGVTNSRGSVTFNNVIAGSYSLHASKSGFGNNDAQVTVKSQQTAVITIPLREDLNEPTVSVTLNPENSGIPQRTFTVTAEDDIQGSGIAKITLYVDEVPVAIWTTAGTHNYNSGFYSIGTHTYYVEAVDNAGNIARNPASGDLKFTVVEGAYMEQTELWKLIGVVLVLANGTALLFFSLRRKKGKQ